MSKQILAESLNRIAMTLTKADILKLIKTGTDLKGAEIDKRTSSKVVGAHKAWETKRARMAKISEDRARARKISNETSTKKEA